MMFGPCNAPSTFQKMMNEIFQDEIRSGWVIIFINDILIHHSDIAAHWQMVQQVLQKLEEHGLCLKPEKCEFERSSVKFLGMVIGNGQVDMDPKKVEAVTSWPVPTMRTL